MRSFPRLLLLGALVILSTLLPNESSAADAMVFPPTIACPIDLTTTLSMSQMTPSGLQFGSILLQKGGTITVAPDGARTSTGVELENDSPHHADHFMISGWPNYAFNVTLPKAAVISCGADNLLVDHFTSNPSGTGCQANNSGYADLSVGATVHIGDNQPPGHYSGGYEISISYE